MQRFAKPWWKRRAVRMFRDESSLAANPHLWTSITEALDSSEWFVLLLSRDAASSEWVGKEIEHWVGNRDSSKILPVVTDGEFGWADGDVTGSSVPPALQGVFSEEPRWVDLRFARGEDQLDLKNPDFSAAVADVASAVRGVPKDELASEEVRQHRRTLRIAWAAGILVAVFAMAAVLFGVQARQQASAARAGQLAADAVNALERDPELATLLALEAASTSPKDELTPAVQNALWRADAANRLVDVIEIESHFFVIDLSPDGTHLAISDEINGEVHWYDLDQGEFEWTYAEPDTVDTFAAIAISPDGERIAVSVVDSEAPAAGRTPTVEDDKPNRVIILGADGVVEKVIPIEDCESADLVTWSPEGRFLAYTSGLGGCAREGDSKHWIEVLDTETWERRAYIPTPGALAGALPSFDASGRLFMLGPFNPALVGSAETFSVVNSIDGSGAGEVTPDGGRIVVVLREDQIGYSPAVIDVETGQIVDILTPVDAEVGLPYGISVSTTGRHVILANGSNAVFVFDLASGDRVFSLPGGPSITGIVDDERGLAYTAHNDGTIKIWDLKPNTAALTNLEDLGDASMVFGDSFTTGSTLGSFIHLDQDRGKYLIGFFDPATGALTDDSLEGLGVVALDDDRFVVLNQDNEWFVYDLRTGTSSQLITCDTPGIECDDNAPARLPCEDCEETTEALMIDVIVSPDGSEIFGHTPQGQYGGGKVVRLDESGVVVEELASGDGLERVIAISDQYVMGEVSPLLEIRDRRTGEVIYFAPTATSGIAPDEKLAVVEDSGVGIQVVSLPSGVVSSIPLNVGEIRGLAFDEDGSRVAIAGLAAVAIVDLQTRSVVQRVGITGASDLLWLGDDALLVGTIDGRWGQLSLDSRALLVRAQAGLRRSFTDAECQLYGIDPCPTLEEIKSR